MGSVLLRTDAEYPGTETNRKILWVVLMILFHVVSIAYFFMVFLKIKRGSLPAPYCPPSAAYRRGERRPRIR